MNRALVILALVASAACDAPELREYEVPHRGLVRGTIFYPAGAARGNVIVLLFSTSALPPPTGTGRPVNFVVIPEKQMFGSAPAGEAHDFTAPFTIPAVPEGTYQIRAFLDADKDFNPIYDLLAQPTAGDVGGGYVDATTKKLLELSVSADQIVESSVLVVLGQTLPVERPAFAITSSTGATLDAPTITVPLRAPGTFTITSHPISRSEVRMDRGRTAFLVTYQDENGDGVIDDANGDHLPDVYPRVILRRVVTPDDARPIIIPLIVNPLPFQDALQARGSTVTTRLTLIVPPVAVDLTGGLRTVLPDIPPGDYETIVISGTGQTWQVPNDLDAIQPGEVDPTQSVRVKVVAGPVLPAGSIRGQLLVDTSSIAPGYVIAFRAEDPPPPEGTGRPVALATVGPTSPSGAGRAGTFELRGLPPGQYLLSGLYDIDGDFSPLVPILSQPTAGDIVGRYPAPITVGDGPAGEEPTLRATTVLPFERPAFAIAGNVVRLSRRPVPQTIQLDAHPVTGIVMDPAKVKLPVALAGRPPPDLDGDHLPDLYPRIILTRMVDGPPAFRAPDDPARIIVPAIVDPLPYLTALGAGVPLIPADSLRVIVFPIAFSIDAMGRRTPISPIPAGRYRVNLLSPTGQTWSVPNDLDTAFARRSTPRADPTQSGYVELLNDPIPGGVIRGEVETSGASLMGEYRIIVLAFAQNAPPPPAGTGRPLASAVLTPAQVTGTRAPFVLAGLPSGRYTVRAFLDANGSFTPWFDSMSQPDQGDVPGAYLEMGVPGVVEVDDLGAPAGPITVTLIPPAIVAQDRPVFTLGPDAMFSRQTGGRVRLDAVSSSSDVLRATGRFVVDARDPMTGALFPIVIAELLDPMDRTRTAGIIIPGILDPAMLGVDPFDPMTHVVVSALDVTFPPIGVDASTGMPTGMPPPAGAYRVTVILKSGQTWSVPNELARATGDPLAVSQARVLTVTE